LSPKYVRTGWSQEQIRAWCINQSKCNEN